MKPPRALELTRRRLELRDELKRVALGVGMALKDLDAGELRGVEVSIHLTAEALQASAAAYDKLELEVIRER